MSDGHRELADELRAILRLVNDRELSDETAQRALEHARSLRGVLVGPRRPRWYESLTAADPGARASFAVHSPLRGWANPLAPPLHCELTTLADGTRAVVGTVWCSLLYEGPPGGVHGGYVAALFDEILGTTQQLVEGPGGLTGTLTVRYRALTPLETELRFVSSIASVRGRRIVARATCHAGDRLTAEAEGLFVRVDMKQVARRAVDGTP